MLPASEWHSEEYLQRVADCGAQLSDPKISSIATEVTPYDVYNSYCLAVNFLKLLAEANQRVAY